MKLDFSYMEVVAKPTISEFKEVSLETLTSAMDRSAIHTFGWPIAVVLHTNEGKPKPITNGIESKIENLGHREYWCLMRTGEFYFIGELFENMRKPESVFIDTRTNRITETFLRIGKLYSILGMPEDEKIELMIKHANIKNKVLAVANPARMLFEKRKCNVPEVKTDFLISVKEMLCPDSLKKNVYMAIRNLAEMFDMFNPDKAGFTDRIVDSFLKGRIA
ncbi:MAG: hypothetical protein HQM16_16345 [Deltaproteobacteria bacterium]|nr:hypothetical protein [Deltaproteobacteria bacterium]